jgi:Zn-dependent protease with chaperone function
MAWLLATLTGGWLAAMMAMAAASLPVAALTKLLPLRYCRLSALLWQAVSALGWIAFVATIVAAPRWFEAPLRYTPHLERPLPHVCFLVLAGTVGWEYLRVASVAVLLLFIVGLGRMALGLIAALRASRSLGASAEPATGPDGGPVLLLPAGAGSSVYAGQPAFTVGFLRPATVVAEKAMARLSPGASAAVVAHERDHARWHDPLAQFLLGATAYFFPGLGWIAAAHWRRHSEHAADTVARAAAGEEPWREAMRVLSGEGMGALVQDRLSAADGPLSPAPAVAAGGGWLLLCIAAWPVAYPFVAMTLFCALETTMQAWR